MNTSELLAVARGDQPADLLLRNGRVVNVFSGDIEDSDVALFGGRIAGVGAGYSAVESVDLQGAFIAPGLIDAHVHIESSLCLPAQFAAAVVPRGVTTVVADPHEIANVAGVDGVRYMAECSRALPLQVVLMAPSAVPATHMETSGASLSAEDLAALLEEGTVHGLAELMNFPGVVYGDPDVLAKVAAFGGRPLDGHAPALSGPALNAYAAAGAGSDHECATVAEAAEKLARGFYILIRKATNSNDLDALLPLVNEHNNRRICLCTDDRIPSDLIMQGSIDHMLRETIAFGIEPVTAFRMATLNSAEWFGLHDRGAVAPGRRADLIVFEDLRAPSAAQVYAGGRLSAEGGRLLDDPYQDPAPVPAVVSSSVRVAWDAFDLRIPADGARVRVIGSLQDQLLTEERIIAPLVKDGQAMTDRARDILKMAVVDRHTASGATGLGFIQGFGLKRGAIAGTVAHDHHNLVVIGADDESMTTAARTVAEMGGGLAVAEGPQALATLPLPVAGLMSDRPLGEVRNRYDSLLDAAHEFGSSIRDPFMAMSFMALEVIPKLKLTDQGLVDVEAFDFVDLFVSE
ncbi:MAG: adenine deaminase [Caldilineaceae bacterium SB0670_bin_27]|uniref:Adenine deaminase n=1 Tax=Caldilineaceae bacterium SB0664_bin_27 TaxID=2605260 RepID=A0A6B0YNF5_9CHLR|nr:adenine deaminase [Caldilineaceae bacterium SB0664_bin_27]MYJ76605.1 adenine deaminase [Caldilineaceae bacterium SB0670_bin_27]